VIWFAKVGAHVVDALKAGLRDVLDRPAGKWTEIVTGFKEIWGAHTKSEFEKMRRVLPVPKVVQDN
jgi:hypothetical protein